MSSIERFQFGHFVHMVGVICVTVWKNSRVQIILCCIVRLCGNVVMSGYAHALA